MSGWNEDRRHDPVAGRLVLVSIEVRPDQTAGVTSIAAKTQLNPAIAMVRRLAWVAWKSNAAPANTAPTTLTPTQPADWNAAADDAFAVAVGRSRQSRERAASGGSNLGLSSGRHLGLPFQQVANIAWMGFSPCLRLPTIQREWMSCGCGVGVCVDIIVMAL